MQLGMIGLGRMGANIVRRLMRDGHECVVYDVNEAPIAALESEGAIGAARWPSSRPSYGAARGLDHGARGDHGRHVDELAGPARERRHRDRRRQQLLPRRRRPRRGARPAGIHYVDVGTSGGVFGLERGFCMMIGGEDRIVHHLDPIFRTLAPGVEMAPRTPGRHGPPAQAEHGYLHCGGHGAGHFVKMVHNGIEYGMMAALAEGLAILKKADIGLRSTSRTPRRAPARPAVLPVPVRHARGRRGLAARQRDQLVAARPEAKALQEDPESRRSRATSPTRARAAGRCWRRSTRASPRTAGRRALRALQLARRGDYADKLLSALRKQFGGHVEQKPPA